LKAFFVLLMIWTVHIIPKVMKLPPVIQCSMVGKTSLELRLSQWPLFNFQSTSTTSRWTRWRWWGSGLCWPSRSRTPRPPYCMSGGKAKSTRPRLKVSD